ncbi:MAG: hypothetical protein H6727_01715 [Myxococcales bacterium]|nr:hypothetical protein [Myxococcales bacterium]
MRNLLSVVGLCSFFVFTTSPTHAQQSLKGYLESCQPLECDAAQFLTCAGQSAQPFCALMCDVRLPKCPRGEPCAIQADGQGACMCSQDTDCLAPLKCVDGQCAGTVAWTAQCSDTAPCGRGLLCVQAAQETNTYCRPLCTVAGTTCTTGEPCVLLSGNTYPSCYCASKAECSDGKNCVNGRCVAPPVYGEKCDESANINCRTGLICTKHPDLNEFFCMSPCASDVCIGGERCFDASNRQRVCVCTKNDPCPTGVPCVNGTCIDSERCDPQTPCKTGSQCVTTTGSYGGICRPKCTTAADCQADGTTCKNIQGALLCACGGDQDCPSGQVCSQYRCIVASSEPSEPTEPVEPSEATEGTSDAGEKSPPENTTQESLPQCNPACSGKQRCNKGTCEMLELREFCELDTDCKSGFCFSADARVKICSTKDCSQCGLLGLQCLQGNGSEGCYYPPYIAPVPDTGQAVSCNSNQSDPSLFSLFGLFLLVLLFHKRLSSSQKSL